MWVKKAPAMQGLILGLSETFAIRDCPRPIRGAAASPVWPTHPAAEPCYSAKQSLDSSAALAQQDEHNSFAAHVVYLPKH